MVNWHHLLEWILPFKFLKLDGQGLGEELVYRLIATADLDLDAASHDLEHQAAGAKVVDTFGLADEHQLELLLVLRVVVHVLGELEIHLVLSHGHVVWEAALDVHNVAS